MSGENRKSKNCFAVLLSFKSYIMIKRSYESYGMNYLTEIFYKLHVCDFREKNDHFDEKNVMHEI